MSQPFQLSSNVVRGGKTTRKKARQHRFLGLPPRIWEFLRDYCQDSSLHGLKYVCNPDVRYIERCSGFFYKYMWLAMFLFNLSLSFWITYIIWVKWRERPFLVTFDSIMTPIYDLPFPSVTVCSYTAVRRSFLDLSTTDNRTLLFYASLVCPVKEILVKKVKEVDYVRDDFFEFIKQAGPDCSEMFSRCSFGSKIIDCCDIFEPSVTENGFCYNFNHLPLDRILSDSTHKPYPSKEFPSNTTFWNPQDGFPDKESADGTYPRRQYIAQEMFGLNFQLNENASEWQNLCTGGYSGFKLIVATPSDLPTTSSLTLHVSTSHDVHVMVVPNTLHSPPDLVTVRPVVRSCYFASEHSLRLFRQYSESNCDLECLSMHYARTCGCVPYYFPRNSTTRICSRKKDPTCLVKSKASLTKDSMDQLVETDGWFTHPCGCFKGCHELFFKTSISSVKHTEEDEEEEETTVDRGGTTNVDIYYGKNQFLGQHRKLRFTTLRFLSSCGGILSLFLGFSMVSGVEIVYVFCLRPLLRALCCRNASGTPPERGQRVAAPSTRVRPQATTTLPPII